MQEIWDGDGQLDWFTGWLWSGMTGLPGPLGELDDTLGNPGTVRVDQQWIDRQRAIAEESGIPNPLSGGSDPLHLSVHFDGPLALAPAADAWILRSDRASRRATLTTSTTTGWYRTLHNLGSELPDLGDRSWHVDVFTRPVGWLGTFRRSRVTGRWFAGSHSVHMRGNA